MMNPGRPITTQHHVMDQWQGSIARVVGRRSSRYNGSHKMYIKDEVKSIGGDIALVAIIARPGLIRDSNVRCGG